MGKDLKGKNLGTGVSQRKDGVYTARYTDRFGRRCQIYANTEREIKKKYRDAKYEDEHDVGTKRSNPRVDEWFYAWVNTFAKSKLKQSTIETYMQSYKSHIQPYFGKRRVQQLTPYEIQQWLVHQHELGSKSTGGCLAVLKSMLNDAVVAGVLESNPADKIRNIKHETRKNPSLTLSQLRYLLSHFDYESNHVDWQAVVQFLAMTGYRFGEMAGLQWQDVDWNHHKIYVRRILHTQSKRDSKYYFTTPKSSSSIRATPLSAELESLLHKVESEQISWKMKYQQQWEDHMQYNNVDDLVFTSRYGTALNRDSLKKALQVTINRLNKNLPPTERLPYITAHGLRGTFANVCYEQQVPIKDVQTLLGHGERYMTLYYTSAKDENVNSSMSAIGVSILQQELAKHD